MRAGHVLAVQRVCANTAVVDAVECLQMCAIRSQLQQQLLLLQLKAVLVYYVGLQVLQW
jgi:hypothetical protein